MKCVLLGLSAAFLVTQAFAAAPATLSQTEQVSYALGQTLGANLKKQEVSLDSNYFIKGFTDAFQGQPSLLSAAEIKQAMSDFQKEMVQKEQTHFKQTSDANQTSGENFLRANKVKPGVITLPDGLEYKVLQAGEGSKPTKDDIVEVDYEGKLIDGTVFDSSYQRGKPATFRVADVIQGWQEILQLMPVGSTWEVYIPSALAYGAQGIPGHIEPNSALMFKVHLIAIKSKTTTAAVK